jgi:hypothetical protein
MRGVHPWVDPKIHRTAEDTPDYIPKAPMAGSSPVYSNKAQTISGSARLLNRSPHLRYENAQRRTRGNYLLEFEAG